MAIYATPQMNGNRQFANECGITMQFVQGPPMAPSGWLGIWVYYVSMQVSWRNAAGAHVGGGHFGLIWQNTLPDKKHSAVNFGIYDDTPGHADFAVFRGSIPTDPQFVSDGGTETYLWDWDYGDTVTFRVFKSPKQNYVASELTVIDTQVPPYVGTNQQPDEVAFRCTVQRNTLPPVFYRDILVKGASGNRPMHSPVSWLEPLIDQDGEGDPVYEVGDWPYNPIGRIKDFVWDGRKASLDWIATYNAEPNSDCVINGDWIEYRGNKLLTRTVPDGTIINPPSTFYKASPANVSPNSSLDPAARATTPRPWF